MGKRKWNVFQNFKVGHQQKVEHRCCKALWLVYVPLGLTLNSLYFVYTVYL
jgi:hypothetical protein